MYAGSSKNVMFKPHLPTFLRYTAMKHSFHLPPLGLKRGQLEGVARIFSGVSFQRADNLQQESHLRARAISGIPLVNQ
jgi:hypothetical protein